MTSFTIKLQQLNSNINQTRPEYEQKKVTSLIINKPYTIEKLSSVSTKYGKVILAFLVDDKDNTVFKTWLPKRLTEYIAEDMIATINQCARTTTLTYLGQSAPNTSGMSRSLIEFDHVEL